MRYRATQEIKVLEALSLSFKESSQTSLRKMLKTRRVSIDGNVILRGDTILRVGQNLEVGSAPIPSPPGLPIFYVDKDLIVVNKPDGLLSVALVDKTEKNALSLLREHFRSTQIFAVHRIDRETSGVMIFARGRVATRALKNMFEKHEFRREYLAVLKGELKRESGTWKSSLVEQEDYSVRSTRIPGEGRIAITHFEVIKAKKGCTYLKLRLETGRKHQIRVHCLDAGHHIIGDRRYGGGKKEAPRMCLHAVLIEFKHPTTGKIMYFEAPLPGRFRQILNKYC